eukprot:TRINITY_DN3855_c1_g1_i1.p1 TRINITY_DN3855_c1_g1~~TRINITY_DN3855_c1_g1_i1.p1  ORF type:complete len:434 (-),score=58.74 TRINITY_DN3855_c1_g1_i1:241-1542(-)
MQTYRQHDLAVTPCKTELAKNNYGQLRDQGPIPPETSSDDEEDSNGCPGFCVCSAPREKMVEHLRKLGASKLLLWQLQHPQFMQAFFLLKLALAIVVFVIVSSSNNLRIFQLAEAANIATLTIKVVWSVAAVWLGTCELSSWYCWREFLAEDAATDLENQGMSSMARLLQLRADRNIMAPTAPLNVPSGWMLVLIISLLTYYDLKTGQNWKQTMQFVFTQEPLMLILAVFIRHFCDGYGVALKSIVEVGTDRLIIDYIHSLEERLMTWRELTIEHQEMDALLERVWHEVFGWRVLQSLALNACYAFSTSLLVLAAESILVKAASAVGLVVSLVLIGRVALTYARYTELCIRRTAGTIRGQRSIMRTATEMFGRVEEVDAHANFVLYLKATQCGVELPVIGLLTFEVVARHTVQALTVVPTGLALTLAVLHEKT